MNQRTMTKLDQARGYAGIPFVLNSAYRSREWDISKGRSGDGPHTHHCAVDIRCNTSANRMKIVKALLKVGFTRIGIGQNYVHVDDDETKPQGVMWHYY